MVISLLLLPIRFERCADMIQQTSDRKVGYWILTSISSVIIQWSCAPALFVTKFRMEDVPRIP